MGNTLMIIIKMKGMVARFIKITGRLCNLFPVVK